MNPYLKKIKEKIWGENYQKVSYSQCGEDLIVEFLLNHILNIERPTYLEIGAYHPRKFSNTFLFYQQKCNGVLIEPDPKLFAAIKKERGNRDICMNVGISDKSGTMDFYMMSIPALNTFSEEEAKKYSQDPNIRIEKTLQIPTITVNELLESVEYIPNFVSIDVEGFDLTILQMWDFRQYRPEVFCVETVEYSKNGTGKKNEDIIELMLENGYQKYADTFINTIFKRVR